MIYIFFCGAVDFAATAGVQDYFFPPPFPSAPKKRNSIQHSNAHQGNAADCKQSGSGSAGFRKLVDRSFIFLILYVNNLRCFCQIKCLLWQFFRKGIGCIAIFTKVEINCIFFRVLRQQIVLRGIRLHQTVQDIFLI